MRLVEGQAVADHERLESHRKRAKSPGLDRGPPLAPSGVAKILEAVRDDRDEIGLETAAALKPPQDGIVIADQMQPDRAGEVVGVGGVQAMTPADRRDRTFDERVLRQI